MKYAGLALVIIGATGQGGMIAHYGFVDGKSDIANLACIAWYSYCALTGLGIGMLSWGTP